MTHAELSVSNICWPDGQAAHQEAINTLVDLEVPAIDIAPTKVWPKILEQGPQSVDREDIEDFTRTLQGRRIAGFQSLTYGTEGNIFSDPSALKERVKGLADLAQRVGALTLIYGSPKTRGLPRDKNQIRRGAGDFFVELCEHADERGIILGLEPVSKSYIKQGFGRTADEITTFASSFDNAEALWREYPRLVPDTFAMADAKEPPLEAIDRAWRYARLAPHWQVSEPGMQPVGSKTKIKHVEFGQALSDILSRDQRNGGTLRHDPESRMIAMYTGPVTVAIEMSPDTNRSVTDSLTRAVQFVREQYPVVQ